MSERDKLVYDWIDSALPTVFISYSWDDSLVADEIERELTGKANIIRDKKNVPHWGSLSKFMKSIREQDFAVLIISEQYLTSDACLYEVMQLMKDEGWSNKSMYVVLEGSNIYKSLGRAKYVEYWATHCNSLGETIKALPPSSTAELSADLRKATMIRDNIGEFLSVVADSSNPKKSAALKAIINRVQPGKPSKQGSKKKIKAQSNQVDSTLSMKAVSILVTACSKGEGIIICTQTLSGYEIAINSTSFVRLSYDAGKEIASWKSALKSLLDLQLIEDHGKKQEVFVLTELGYNTADEIKAGFNGEHIDCEKCHYSGPSSNDKCPICGFQKRTLTATETKVLSYITEHVNTNSSETSQACGLSTQQVRRVVQYLSDLGLIEIKRVGRMKQYNIKVDK